MNNEVCARCEHFTGKDTDDKPLPQMQHGIGRCKGFDGHVAPTQPFVRWDGRTCVLFGRARDMGARNAWIEARKAREA